MSKKTTQIRKKDYVQVHLNEEKGIDFKKDVGLIQGYLSKATGEVAESIPVIVCMAVKHYREHLEKKA